MRISSRMCPPNPERRPRRLTGFACALFMATALLADITSAEAAVHPSSASEWAQWGHTLAGTRYVPATQIDTHNVGQLKIAWRLHTGDDLSRKQDERNLPAFEATPLKIGDTLYLCTPHNIILAINADTGSERWRFDPKTNTHGHYLVTCRGVAYYDAGDAASEPGREQCRSRILAATLDARLLALDAHSGKQCPSFGDHGSVSLLTGLGHVEPGYYSVTSAPTVVRGLVIIGALVLDNMSTDEPSGVVRAYDIMTGALRWAWDPGTDGPPAALGATYSRGSPNAWGPFSADPALGLVYVPTGNRAPDYWGAFRSSAEETYSSAVVALDIDTGQPRWVFQTVHHDLWDYDVASQPVLTDFPTSAGVVPALIQATKTGQLFVLDRRSGRPLTEVIERAVPQAPAPGERLSPTQPFSVGMPSLHPQTLTEEQLWGLTPIDRYGCVREFRKHRHEGLFTPPSLQGTITYPMNLGASSWGSVSIDEEHQILLANTNRLASIVQLIPRAEADRREAAGETLYMPQRNTPYAVTITPFLSALGIPCTPPPWGELTAIDLKTRKVLWRKPLGNTRDLAPLGIERDYGVPNVGGSLVTAGGLTFIAATTDRYLRAYDTATGQELWRSDLPAGGQATPMSYVSESSGRQFVVIAAGGHEHLGSKLGDSVIAYALPR
jgi:quinoprotein glucose dehydrogenase